MLLSCTNLAETSPAQTPPMEGGQGCEGRQSLPRQSPCAESFSQKEEGAWNWSPVGDWSKSRFLFKKNKKVLESCTVDMSLPCQKLERCRLLPSLVPKFRLLEKPGVIVGVGCVIKCVVSTQSARVSALCMVMAFVLCLSSIRCKMSSSVLHHPHQTSFTEQYFTMAMCNTCCSF